MAQVKLLKIDTDGVPVEFNSAADEITLASFSVQGGGPVLSATGLDMNSTDISDVEDLVFEDPTTSTINQTAGNLIINNIVAKERANVFTTAGDITFPVIADSAGQVDAFRLPALAGTPTATPTSGGEGHMVWDSTNNKVYIWDGAAWDDQSTVSSANSIQNSYTAEVALLARDAVYISSADNVSKAQGLNSALSYAVGFATTAASAAAPVVVQSEGVLTGFSGLTAGARYYLSGAAAGTITTSIPVGAGNTVVQMGYAKSATALQIHIEQMGRRA